MNTEHEILIRLDRIEQALTNLAKMSLPEVDNQADRLIRLARIDRAAAIASAKSASRQDTLLRQKLKKEKNNATATSFQSRS
ncbi:MAG: hypothetical protein KJ900_13685 [Proteobacteria bacterium]|jgi:hypothetical protein|nr:hypothetical protein [Desulfocapsa sp.]MBU3945489.1 hypothetical protein [Pseudomonadota bacterium]MCG2745121.1 hypothetical protein [Desulfobacteraceae bacterium]MBU4029200.1 hypothetical protein [Pseudomonadota bacterium]MBU4043929.1 hypothetical protein [Pseudomonadota bacterium]